MDAKEPRAKKGTPCPKCGNLLRLRSDQLGEQVKCPKCNAAFTVGRPEAAAPATASTDDLYEPEIPLRKSTIVPEEPVEIVYDEAPQMRVAEPGEADMAELAASAPLAQDVEYEVNWSSAEGELEMERPHERPVTVEPEYLQLAESRGLLRSNETPYHPRWMFLSTVFEFPWMGQNAWRWGTMAFGMIASGLLIVPLLHMFEREPDLLVPFVVLLTVGTTLLTVVASSAFLLSAIHDTADGYREVQASSLDDWDQWFVLAVGVVFVAALSALVGYPFSLIEQVGTIAIPIAMLILFPFLLLSAMDGGSYLTPYSPRILRSLARMWWTWILFYLISATLVIAWTLSMLEGYQRAPYLTVFLAGPALAALVLIYARLLGRIAWKAGFVLDAGDDSQPEGNTTASGRSKRRRKGRRRGRRRIDFPPELDQAARFVNPPPDQPFRSQRP